MDHPIRGQRVDRGKVEIAKALRAEQTAAEARLWSNLRHNQLRGLHFRRQQIILGFVVDFYCHAARLAVEVDGGVHDEQVEADVERESILVAAGLRVIRFANAEVEDHLASVLARISEAAADADERRALPPFPRGEGGQGG